MQSVAGKLGRAETPTDPAPVEMIETIIELKPEAEWRAGYDPRPADCRTHGKDSQGAGLRSRFPPPD